MLAALSDSENPFSFLLVILTGSIDTKITSTASYKNCVYKTRLFDSQKCTQFYNESAHLPLIAFLTMWPFSYFFLLLICSSNLDYIALLSVLLIHARSIWPFDDVQCAVQLRNPQTMSRKNMSRKTMSRKNLGAAWISQQCHVMKIIIDDSEHNHHHDLWSPQFITILHRWRGLSG